MSGATATPAWQASTLTDAEHGKQLRRAVIASTIGTTIEWYDFFVYGTVTGLVFAKLYFPRSDPLVGTLEAFTIYAVGFVARPVGAAIFGHWGDRLGRKSALIATLMLMGIATFLVGLVPTYDSIGIWGAVVLTALRFIQGVGVGGEWGGSVLMSMEWARSSKHRGFVASWPQFGVPAGLFLANLAVLAFSGCPAMRSSPGAGVFRSCCRSSWSASGCGSGWGFWRPRFPQVWWRKTAGGAPITEVFRKQPKEVFLSAFARMGEQAPFYIFTAFVFAYGVGTLQVSRDMLLLSVLVGILRVVRHHPAGRPSVGPVRAQAHLPDRHRDDPGVRLDLFRTAEHAACRSGSSSPIVASLIPHDTMYGPQAALIAESFTGRLRYSGASIGYQLASIIAGGPAPLVATALLATYHSWVRSRSISGVLRHQPHRGGDDDGLHQPGHLGRIRRTAVAGVTRRVQARAGLSGE